MEKIKTCIFCGHHTVCKWYDRLTDALPPHDDSKETNDKIHWLFEAWANICTEYALDQGGNNETNL